MKGGKEQGIMRREWEEENDSRFLRLVKIVRLSDFNEFEFKVRCDVEWE